LAAKRELLELVNRPKTLGFQADMAHTMLFTMGFNAPEMRYCRRISTGRSPINLRSVPEMANALRPWTIDFHVAQNDGTVKGAGTHDKTGRHCLPTDPNGKLDIVRDTGAWIRGDDGNPTRAFTHICWDGCMFPNQVMTDQQNLERRAARDDCGPRSARVELMKKKLNVGMVGYGFMGRTHSNAFSKVANFFDLPFQPVLKTILREKRRARTKLRRAVGLREFRYGLARVSRVARHRLSGHRESQRYACGDRHCCGEAGKMVMCEKPLGRNAAESEAIVAAVEAAGVANMVWYNYRRVPAVWLAKELIAEGRLGKIFHYRAKFLQDWTISSDLPQGGEGLWRLDAAVAGSGVTGDLLAHTIDTALWLNGPIAEVSAMTETFVKSRQHSLTGKS